VSTNVAAFMLAQLIGVALALLAAKWIAPQQSNSH
jgi:hypothetical protein